MRLDLHVHSSHSPDGEIAPGSLVRMAADAGIGCLAVADHNRASAVPEAMREGKRHGVTIIPAIELDCRYNGIDLHVLGYGIDPSDRRFAEVAEKTDELERQAADQRVDAVRRLGLRIDPEALRARTANATVTSELLAEIALLDQANSANNLLLPYRPGGARSDNPLVNFHWDHCARGKPAFVEIPYMPLAEAVEHITAAGGLAVLAHPGVNMRGKEDMLAELLERGIRGVEAFSSYHLPGQADFWREKAVRHQCFFTCGSDFHGKTKPAIPLGGHGGALWENEITTQLGILLPKFRK